MRGRQRRISFKVSWTEDGLHQTQTFATLRDVAATFGLSYAVLRGFVTGNSAGRYVASQRYTGLCIRDLRTGPPRSRRPSACRYERADDTAASTLST